MKLLEKLEKAKGGTPMDLFLDEIIKDVKELEAMLEIQQSSNDNARYAQDFDPCTRVVLNCKYMQALGRIQDLEIMMQWQSIETVPKMGEFLVAVWEGDWNNRHQKYRIYHAMGYQNGPSWAVRGNYRTQEGEAYKLVGWMQLPKPPQPN